MKKHSRFPFKSPASLGCLYCGVDSGPVVGFFVWMIGAGLLGFVCVYLWGHFNGKFDDVDERASRLSLEAEASEGEK